jgi:hypothetical protein
MTTISSASVFFKMHSGSHVLSGCSAPPEILPQVSQLCQNVGLSVLSSVRKQTKVGWVGDNSHVDFGQTFLGEKEVLR